MTVALVTMNLRVHGATLLPLVFFLLVNQLTTSQFSSLSRGFGPSRTFRRTSRQVRSELELVPLFFRPCLRLLSLDRSSTIWSTKKPLVGWSKHGYICLAIPGHDPPIDVTIFMDVSKKPAHMVSR